MIKSNATIKMDFGKISKLTRAATVSLEKTGEALHTEVVQAQVVPRDSGNLQNESMFLDKSDSAEGVVSLVHSTPYARRMYYHPEYNFKKTENPNAKAHWFEDWEDGGSKSGFTRNTFKKIFKKESGI